MDTSYEIVHQPVGQFMYAKDNPMDRRTRKTRAAIHLAMASMIIDTPLERITVTELCRRADISKSTFYLHFHDVYDCADWIRNEILEATLGVMATYPPRDIVTNMGSILKKTIQVFHDKPDTFMPFLKSTSFAPFLFSKKDLLVERIVNRLPKSEDPVYLRLSVSFLLSGILGLLEEFQYGTISDPILEKIEHQIQNGFDCL